MKRKSNRGTAELPKPVFHQNDLAKLKERSEKLGSDDILEAIDLCLNGLIRYVADYRRMRDTALLGEAKMTAESMFALCEELERRQGAISEIAPTRQLH